MHLTEFSLASVKALPKGELFVRWSPEYFRGLSRTVLSPMRAAFNAGDLRQAVYKLQNVKTLPNFATQAEVVAYAGNAGGGLKGFRWRHAWYFTTENPIKLRPASSPPMAPPSASPRQKVA